MGNCYVIADYGASCHVLTLESRTPAEAAQAISWQRQGGFTQPFHICEYDPENRDFVARDGSRFVPVNGSYTDRAWLEFLERVDPTVAEAGAFGMPAVIAPGR